MRNFLIRVIINAVAIAITASIMPGIVLGDDGVGTLLIIGLVFGLVNALVKPFLILLTCPAVILTLGLFILVINGAMLMLTSTLLGAERLFVDGWGQAILGGIIMSIVSMILEGLLGLDENRSPVSRDIDRDRRIPRDY